MPEVQSTSGHVQLQIRAEEDSPVGKPSAVKRWAELSCHIHMEGCRHAVWSQVRFKNPGAGL